MTRPALKLLTYIAAGLLILAGLNHLAGFVPFTPQWSAKRAETRADRLAGQVSSLERAAEGQAEITEAVTTYHTREVVIREGTAQAITDNGQADDATTPLSPERAARLRAHDRVLCDHTGLCAPADDAGRGAQAVPDLDAPG